jgi:hypothetical protein
MDSRARGENKSFAYRKCNNIDKSCIDSKYESSYHDCPLIEGSSRGRRGE